MKLWQAENEFLSVSVDDNAVITLTDRASGERWQTGPVALQEENPVDIGHVWLRNERSFCEQFAGRFRGERVTDDTFRFFLMDNLGMTQGVLTCQFRLEGEWFEVRILDIAEALPSLVFPPPLVSESLVLPQGVGRWITSPLPASFAYVYPAHLNMRWFGGLRGDHGWLAVLHEGYTSSGAMASALTVAPLWLKSMGRWQGARAVRYRLTQGGYVGLAKAYRAYLQTYGLFRSLDEKAAADPRVHRLRGGRLVTIWQAEPYHRRSDENRLLPVSDGAQDGLKVYFTHQQAKALIGQIREAGMEQGLIVLRGWINGGYDERHPDVWPPEPALGTPDELREVMAEENGLIVALHDNYLDMYPQSHSFPTGIIQNRDGRLMRGGLWAGGQAYIVNLRTALGYARRNWEHLKTLNPQAIFPDTATAMQCFESYERGNELTREQDFAYKLELLRFYKDQGVLLGSEEGTDYGTPYVEWYENRHLHLDGVSIPIWGLVFHDAVVCYRYTVAMTDGTWLPELLWGYGKLWHMGSPAEWAAQREAFLHGAEVDRWHTRIGFDELIMHEYLAPGVERTHFTHGRITVNFNSHPVTLQGMSIEAKSYRME